MEKQRLVEFAVYSKHKVVGFFFPLVETKNSSQSRDKELAEYNNKGPH